MSKLARSVGTRSEGVEAPASDEIPREVIAEAIVNAIVHGNRLDPAKKVHVECVVSPDVTRIAITDEGAGFDPASVPDCTSDERLEAPGGRGVMLMRSFMSRIEYNAKGNGVVLEKIRNPADN